MNAEELKVFGLLAEFSEEDREILADLLTERTLPDGKSVFREGAEGDGLVLLKEGHLTLKSKRTGKPIADLEAPAHLGAASLFSFGKREITAQAKGGAVVLLLPRSGLPRLADDAPRAAYRLAEATAAELAVLLRRCIEPAMESVPEDE